MVEADANCPACNGDGPIPAATGSMCGHCTGCSRFEIAVAENIKMPVAKRC